MLLARITTGTLLVAIFVAALAVDEWLAPWYPIWVLLSAVVLGWTSLELVGLLNRTSARPSGNTVFGGTLAVVAANAMPHLVQALIRPEAVENYDPSFPAMVFAWPLWTFIAVVMFAFIAQSVQFEKPGQTMATIAGTVLAVAYVGLLGSFLMQFRWLGGPSEGLVAVLSLFVIAKGADVGAYTFGRLLGRHKLWPRLSPNKTVEGAIGGLAFGVGAALLVRLVAGEIFDRHPLGWGATAVFGLVVGAAAQLGDLMESMIKRDCSQKDASDALPGFGGLLDVMDSLLFAAPVAYACWLLLGSI